MSMDIMSARESEMAQDRTFIHDGIEYRVADNGAYWELHRREPDGSWFTFTIGDEWADGLLDKYKEVTADEEQASNDYERDMRFFGRMDDLRVHEMWFKLDDGRTCMVIVQVFKPPAIGARVIGHAEGDNESYGGSHADLTKRARGSVTEPEVAALYAEFG